METIKQKKFYANYAIKPHIQHKRKTYLDEHYNYRTTLIWSVRKAVYSARLISLIIVSQCGLIMGVLYESKYLH